jgi:hypothetical protein
MSYSFPDWPDVLFDVCFNEENMPILLPLYEDDSVIMMYYG